jgi:hypothetical protein
MHDAEHICRRGYAAEPEAAFAINAGYSFIETALAGSTQMDPSLRSG